MKEKFSIVQKRPSFLDAAPFSTTVSMKDVFGCKLKKLECKCIFSFNESIIMKGLSYLPDNWGVSGHAGRGKSGNLLVGW